jgi:hypothetical protein
VILAALALLAIAKLFEAGMGGADTGDFSFEDAEGHRDETWDEVWNEVSAPYDPIRNPDSARREQQGKDPFQIPKDWADGLLPSDEAGGDGIVEYDPETGRITVRPRNLEERIGFGYEWGVGPMPSWDSLDDMLMEYATNQDPALRASIERLIYTYPDPAYFDTEEEYWQAWGDVGDILSFLSDADAGLYDPNRMPDTYGEYWGDDPYVVYPGGGGRQWGDKYKGGGGGGAGGDSPFETALEAGANAAALEYQRAVSFRRDYGSAFNSGYLRRRRKRSQVLRSYRIRKSGWIDPFPWIPGTEPEKELFEWLVRRRLYFIFQGQVPELEQGQLATLSVPGFEPDFILPQYRIILDPFSPFHHSLPGAELRDIQKVALYESLGYGYYHPWALGPGLWSFDQEGIQHGRFTTEQMLNQIPELAAPKYPLPDKEAPYVGIGYRLGVNLGAGATSVAAANRARVRARTLALTRR